MNTGIRHATGDYISWLSSDDEFTPDKTVKQVRLMQAKGALRICRRPLSRFALYGFREAKLSSCDCCG
ncbi:glycosyltransferase [Alicyclobacillus cycloheptanicus]|uniref:glycosyltransferase n=1 Tax=Alicyclobacillus cycloheptanicus TaxID=1457 RepID=UPI00237953E1|nr:glycosyltransferase [Alicyclobacillus cycloheptanicus]WDM01084.1 glycosyltransferase [Alicyclobacillus cycloheptanicus]